MHHYIALIWPPRDQRLGHEAKRQIGALQRSGASWECLIHREGLSVYSRAPLDQGIGAYTLQGTSGAILGRLFSSDSPGKVRSVSELNSGLSVTKNARRLLGAYWGNYVAILHSSRDEETLVMRDCSGHIPCYYLCFHGLYVFFSDIRDTASFGIAFTINESYLASFILRQPLHVRETGLREVKELLAGDGVVISASGTDQHSVWNPRSAAASNVIDDYTHARALVLSATENVIRAWASVYDRILLYLSGGLDSAIVLGCLKRLGLSERVVCVNHYTEGSADDERYYARIAARQAGVVLEELPTVCDGRVFAEKLKVIPPDPKPDVPKTARILRLDEINDLANKFHCDTLWTGQGGDHIFLQVHNAYAATDYLMQHRFPLQLPAHIYHSAVLSGQSVWSVLAQAMRYKCGNDRVPDPFSTSGRSLVNKSVIDQSRAGFISLPWHDGTPRLPPGKQTQIDLLSDLLNRHKPLLMLERPYEHHPLISQPLIELSLRVPTYHLLRGGRQRSMARDAFADRVPDCILRREDKGCIQEQMRALLRGSAPLLRDTLLNGVLVSHGIIDRGPLEGILLHQDTYTSTQEFALFACIAAESWAQHWTTRTAFIAAA
jgi:asparagine synthase (glutamine-hydrolysing)